MKYCCGNQINNDELPTLVRYTRQIQKKTKKKNFRPTALPKITRKVNGATKGSDLNMSRHVRDVTPQAIFPAIRTQVTLHISHIYSLLAKATYITSDYISNHLDVTGGGGN